MRYERCNVKVLADLRIDLLVFLWNPGGGSVWLHGGPAQRDEEGYVCIRGRYEADVGSAWRRHFDT